MIWEYEYRECAHDVETPLVGTSRDCGDTLLEILITLVVVSLTVVAALFAFSESIGGSATHRTLVTDDVVLRTVAESVYAQVEKQTDPTMYSPCAVYYGTGSGSGLFGVTPTGSATLSAQFGTPTGFLASVTVTGYFYLKGSYGWQPAPLDCSASNPVPEQLQVTVMTPQGSELQTTVVVNGPSS